MKNISDVIEEFLKNILEMSDHGEIEVQRSAIAEKFQCVPSQINYVLSTRFSIDKGFLVESKRGGGGYIRIKKLEITSKRNFFKDMYVIVGNEISQSTSYTILERLMNENFITEKEYETFKAILSREVLELPLPIRDQVRANILKATLRVIFSRLKEEGNL